MHVRHHHIYLNALIHTIWVCDEDHGLLGDPNLIFSPPRLQWRVSLSALEITRATNYLTNVCILWHRSTLYWSWLWSSKSSWIHSVSYRGHDHVYYTWIRSIFFGSRALFPLLSMSMPTLWIIIYGLSLDGCNLSLPSSFDSPYTPSLRYIVNCFGHHLFLRPHTLGGIWYTLIYHLMSPS